MLEHQQWILWTPVGIGVGIGIYFQLYNEPPLWLGSVLLLLALIFSHFLKKYLFLKPVYIGACLIALGFTAAQFRTWWVGASNALVEESSYPRKIIGVVQSIEKKPDKWYVTMKDLGNLPYNTVRFTLRGAKQQAVAIRPGDRVKISVVLMKPPPAPTPEVYNFKQRAYFLGLSAVGYALSPPEKLGISKTTVEHRLQNLRDHSTLTFQKGIKAQEGAIAAALVTGDRSGISPNTRQAFADAGIAHILAISGLHLAIVAGFVFFLIRRGLCLVPYLALRFSTKKIAAAVTLVSITCYLMLC